MSRIGKLPIALPKGVTAQIKPGEIVISGPKGKLERHINAGITVTQQDNNLVVSRADDSRQQRALHGLIRSLIANMVEGVSKGFERYLEIVGVGYRAEASGNKLVLRVGFSHTVEVVPLAGVSLVTESASRVKVAGIDKETVGEMAAKIRAIRPPDAYKGKGIRYAGETVRLKAGKAGKAIGKKK